MNPETVILLADAVVDRAVLFPAEPVVITVSVTAPGPVLDLLAVTVTDELGPDTLVKQGLRAPWHRFRLFASAAWRPEVLMSAVGVLVTMMQFAGVEPLHAVSNV